MNFGSTYGPLCVRSMLIYLLQNIYVKIYTHFVRMYICYMVRKPGILFKLYVYLLKLVISRYSLLVSYFLFECKRNYPILKTDE